MGEDTDRPADEEETEAESTSDPVELRPLRLFLIGLLGTTPIAVLFGKYELGLALFALGAVGVFLLKRLPHCMRTNSLEIIRKAEVERVLKAVFAVFTVGFVLFQVAVPRFGPGTRVNANESAAIATLINLASAQARCQTAAYFDRDGDGIGEFAYFAELAGGSVSRRVQPPLLSGRFANVTSTGGLTGGSLTRGGLSGGVIQRSGYLYQIFLPDRNGRGVPEAGAGGMGQMAPDADRSEREWCCYAWPASFGNSGRRAFFINQDGDVLATKNTENRYTGATSVPAFGSAFRASTRVSLTSSIAANSSGQDKQFWVVVN